MQTCTYTHCIIRHAFTGELERRKTTGDTERFGNIYVYDGYDVHFTFQIDDLKGTSKTSQEQVSSSTDTLFLVSLAFFSPYLRFSFFREDELEKNEEWLTGFMVGFGQLTPSSMGLSVVPVSILSKNLSLYALQIALICAYRSVMVPSSIPDTALSSYVN